jgi:hypothetical protein
VKLWPFEGIPVDRAMRKGKRMETVHARAVCPPESDGRVSTTLAEDPRMNANSWIINEIVIVFFVGVTIKSLVS